MEDDEDTLELSINEYEFQVSQIEAAINHADASDKAELIKLQSDLNQLIELTKDSLLSIKKKRMLHEVGQLYDQPSCSETQGNKEDSSLPAEPQCPTTSATPSAPSARKSSEPDDDLQKLLESLEGTKCQAPFGHEWGQSGYHNALVSSVESCDSIESMQDIQVKVLFCNPLFNAMKPCSHFLEGNCRFSDEECHFSHGHLVSFGDVRQFNDPDYSLLRRDATCLAKYKDGLWYPAVVDSVSEDHRVTLQFIQYKTISEVPLEDVVPTDNLESETSSDDDDDDDDSSVLATLDDSDFGQDDDAPGVGLISSTPSSQMLGEWEKHTRGIGSKLMQKMGYVIGSGLGKHGDGRLEPVEAVLLPQGKSLDKIMSLKEKAGNRNLVQVEKKMKRKQRRKDKKIVQGYVQPTLSVFNFLNKTIGSKSGASENCTKPADNPKKVLKTATVKTLNAQCFKASEDIRKAQQELSRLKNALSRNEMRDALMTRQIKQKIADQERVINELKSYDLAINLEQNIRKGDKKFTKF